MHQVAAAAPRPLASMFKLFVLGALAHQIAAGQVSWNQDLTVTDALKSAGSGSLQDVPAGTRVSVRQTALQMIANSDNTAADMLIHLVGRAAVQAQDRQWSAHAALNVPFLTTREAFLLKDLYPALAQRYLSLAPGQRAAFLASSADPLPFSQAQAQTRPAVAAHRHRHHRMVRLARRHLPRLRRTAAARGPARAGTARFHPVRRQPRHRA